MFPIVCSKLQPQRPYLLAATMDHSSNIDFPTVPGCTVYLHPSRDPHNTNRYVASRITIFVCHPSPYTWSTSNYTDTASYTSNYTTSYTSSYSASYTSSNSPIYSRHTSTNSSTVEAATWWRHDTVQYSDWKIERGHSLSQALSQVNLSKGMFQRRRVIAETYISLPECVKSSLQKANCGGDVESIFLRCRAISKTAKGKSKIREMPILTLDTLERFVDSSTGSSNS